MIAKLNLNRTFLNVASASTVILLAACGGGNSDPADSTMTPGVTLSSVGAVTPGAGTNEAGAAAATPAATTTTAATANPAANAANKTPAAAPSTASSATPPKVAAQTASTGTAAPAPAADSGSAVSPYGQNASLYTMTFSEEFSKDLDPKLWNDKIWYEAAPKTKNYTVEDGKLKIWPARDASGKFFNRTIDTDGHYYQTYGYFEVEAKLPRGKGTWPAFWLFNHIGERRPEIDVMEAYAGGAAPWGKIGPDGVASPTMYAITVWKDQTVQAGMYKHPTVDLSTGFHKYALKWEPGKQTFYFDGKEVYSLNVTMKDPMYLMLDLWYGSASGQPDNSTPTGKANSYEVNYVRAWKMK